MHLTYPLQSLKIKACQGYLLRSSRTKRPRGASREDSVAGWPGLSALRHHRRSLPDEGRNHGDGLYKCSACREPFTVTIGTIFEDSHIPLHKWLLAIHLMCSSKKGISAHQLWRNLWGVNPETGKPYGSYRSAWFMAHRIRWALGKEPVASKLSGIVEIDEAYIGGKFRHPGFVYSEAEAKGYGNPQYASVI